MRLSYIDIAKGVLILFVLMGHALLFFTNEGVNDGFLSGFQHARIYLWTPYYMPAFFVITGFCSNFNKPFPTFLWQNVKSLKIPAILFGTFLFVVSMVSHHTLSATGLLRHVALSWVNSGLWFLDALFISKLLYWCVNKWCRTEVSVFAACAVLFLAGFLYYSRLTGKDYGSIAHALMLTIFLFVGKWMKKRQEVVCHPVCACVCLFLYVLAAFSLSLLDVGMPYITNKIRLEWLSLVPYLFLSVTGSVLIIYLCFVVSRCRWLQWIGEHSLVFYMFNTFALNIAVKLLAPHMTNHLLCIVLYVGGVLFACLILALITRLLNTRYLRFMLGKF